MADPDTRSAETVRIDVFLRPDASPSLVESLRETVTRARHLEDRDAATDVRVETWTSVRPALERLADSGPSVSLIVDAFRRWADREGYALPSFERRETSSMLGHRPTVRIRVPTVCVAVSEGGDLQWVAPCSDGDRTYSVEACLTALENGVTEAFAARGESVRDPSADRFGNRTRPEDGD